MQESNAVFQKMLVGLVNVLDLDRQRAFLASKSCGGILQEYREVIVVLNRYCSCPYILEFDFESKVLNVPVARNDAVANRKHHVIEFDQWDPLSAGKPQRLSTLRAG